MNDSPGDAYRIRLRSLEWASGLLRELSHSEDTDAVVVAANWALDAVYDLWELYRLVSALPRDIAKQDAHLVKLSGELVGGLLFIRGEKTHQAQQVHRPSPFKGLPYDFAALTDWSWTNIGTSKPLYAQRLTWYQDRISERALWVPLDQAFYWFVENSPIDIIGQSAREVPGWIDGVVPRSNIDLHEGLPTSSAKNRS